MAGFLFSLLGVVVTGFGARDQLLIGVLSARLGRRPIILTLGVFCGALTCILAAEAAVLLAGEMNRSARLIFAAIALALAAADLVIARKVQIPAEPTGSLGAFVVVLLAHQLTDTARFLVLAIAVATGTPGAAGWGGALGAATLAVTGWLAGQHLIDRNLTPIRRLLAAILTALAIGLAWSASGR